jgi:hypothetical protein
MLRRVTLVGIDVTEELISSIIGVEGIGELGRTLAYNSFYHDDGSNMFFRNVVIPGVIRRHIPEGGILKIICDLFICCERFDVFTAVTMKNCVFWDVTLCDSCKNRRFGGT